jgi:type II secretory pathway pseudopilin PulG
MIAVVIIGLLAAMAIPAFQKVRQSSRVNAFINDLTTGAEAFETYSMDKGEWPPDGNAGVPPEMAGYINFGTFAQTTQLGGSWDWDAGVFGLTAAFGVHNPTEPQSIFEDIDRKIDDGNLSTGSFRSRSNGYVMVLEP